MSIRFHGKRSCTSGYTLVEVLIAGTIGTVIMGAVITTYLVSVRGFTAISNYSEIHADGRRAVDIFSRDMRTLYQITSYGPSNLVCRLPTGFSSSGAVTSYKTITYSINKGALYRSDSSTGKTSMLATNIYQLNFKLYDRIGSNTTVIGTAKGIQLDIKLRKRVVSQIQSEDYLSARLDMRNKP